MSAIGADLPIRHVRASVAIRAKADLSLSIGEVTAMVRWGRARAEASVALQEARDGL
jgi:hypothetical protein